MQVITSPATAEQFIRPHFQGLDHEECWAIFLSCGNAIISKMMLSKGTMTTTAIDTRTVLRNALLSNAKSIILLHNHLTGNPSPSSADIRFTDKLKKACSLLEIHLVDHLILAEKAFYSFANEQTYQIH